MDAIPLIVASLVAGASAAFKPADVIAVKDAYDGLKSLIKRKYARIGVDLLESDPGDPTRRQLLAQDLTKSAVGDDAEVVQQATASATRSKPTTPTRRR